jgi:hypothetical protein
LVVPPAAGVDVKRGIDWIAPLDATLEPRLGDCDQTGSTHKARPVHRMSIKNEMTEERALTINSDH